MADAAVRGIAWMGAGAADADRLLVQRLAAGEREAVEEMYARHGRAVLAYLHHFTADPALAEEVLQDTLVAAWQGARRFAGRSSLRTWLIGIARRQALAAIRRRGRHPRQWEGEAALDGLPSSEPEPEAAALAAADREGLAAAMRRLSPVHREVLALTFVQGLSYPELASVLGVPLGTVKSRLSNAKRALRTMLLSREEGQA